MTEWLLVKDKVPRAEAAVWHVPREYANRHVRIRSDFDFCEENKHNKVCVILTPKSSGARSFALRATSDEGARPSS